MSVIVVGMHEAKTRLSQLVRNAVEGDEVVISSRGKPVAKLIAFPQRGPRTPGLLAGKIVVKPGFDDVPEGLDVLADPTV